MTMFAQHTLACHCMTPFKLTPSFDLSTLTAPLPMM